MMHVSCTVSKPIINHHPSLSIATFACFEGRGVERRASIVRVVVKTSQITVKSRCYKIQTTFRLLNNPGAHGHNIILTTSYYFP